MTKLFLIFTLTLTLTFTCIPLHPPPLSAESPRPLRVAVAANFINAMETIGPLFTKEYGITIQSAYGSTGKLYAQMKNSAPYDLFLSADQLRPTLLHEAGICEEPFKYVSGSIVLWSRNIQTENTNWQEALTSGRGKIAIANPETAPYGSNSFKALDKAGLLDRAKPRFVYGQSVGQAFVFAQTGNTELGFVALSQALSKHGRAGKYWIIPEAEKVAQWGCASKKSENRDAGEKLISFMASDACQQILSRMGYIQ